MLVLRKSRLVTTGSFSQQFNTEFDSIHLKSTSGYQDWTTNCDPCACASFFFSDFCSSNWIILSQTSMFFFIQTWKRNETALRCTPWIQLNPIPFRPPLMRMFDMEWHHASHVSLQTQVSLKWLLNRFFLLRRISMAMLSIHTSSELSWSPISRWPYLAIPYQLRVKNYLWRSGKGKQFREQ